MPRPLRPVSAKTAQVKRRRTFTPLHEKPAGCIGCPLEHRGTGFLEADGPPTAPILFVGEAAGYDEVAQGRPFVGAAGSMLTRIFRLNGWLREDYRIDNVIRCAPPELVLSGASYAAGAIQHCQYLDQTLAEGHPVVVPLGGTAIRRVLGLGGKKDVHVEDFHGTISRDPTDRFWVVPSFHPSYLQRGATHLLGTVSFDLQVTHEVARQGREPDPATLVCDPDVEWFRAWAQGYVDALRMGSGDVWLAVDIETPDKAADEGTLYTAGAEGSWKVERVNLACHPDEGVTVPFEEPYIGLLLELFREVERLGGTILMWFRGFDMPRLIKAGMPLNHRKVWDLMWLAKVYKSDLPQGLGFWAPFYSRYGPWKHLSKDQPVKYAAIDGFQTLRVGFGLIPEVIELGQWPVFERHLHDFHGEVLQPATDIGVPIDRDRLTAFGQELDGHAHRLLTRIQEIVPEALRPLTPKEGLTRAPAPGEVHTKGRETKKDGTAKKEAPDPIKAAFYQQAQVVRKLVLREVLVCRSCGKTEIHRKHRCEDKTLQPILSVEPMTVTRWFWQEPFNPDSPKQLLEYIRFRGHDPGRNKRSGADSADRETLERLARTGDPLYQTELDYRSVAKVRGTYVNGTFRRLDADNRVHPNFGFKTSMMRTNCTSPNIQNVITDRGGKENLAAGYRRVIKARDEVPGWVDPEALAAWKETYGVTEA